MSDVTMSKTSSQTPSSNIHSTIPPPQSLPIKIKTKMNTTTTLTTTTTFHTTQLSKQTSLLSCTILTLLYVATLYIPTYILRLPPPSSFKQFMIRRFLCAAFSSSLSLLASSLLLLFPVNGWRLSNVLPLYGFHADLNIWRAVVFPVLLTSLMYAGSLVRKAIVWLDKCGGGESEGFSWNITAWRNLVVSPITEELVFRACMIPILLCGGFSPRSVVLVCPLFFSLAHLNHLLEFYSKKNYSVLKTAMAVGTQLAYTMVFGSYASFLFIRTGHLVAPLAAHIVCNYMGLPVIHSQKGGVIVILAFIAGVICYLQLLFPLTISTLYYSSSPDNFPCWQGYCRWS